MPGGCESGAHAVRELKKPLMMLARQKERGAAGGNHSAQGVSSTQHGDGTLAEPGCTPQYGGSSWRGGWPPPATRRYRKGRGGSKGRHSRLIKGSMLMEK